MRACVWCVLTGYHCSKIVQKFEFVSLLWLQAGRACIAYASLAAADTGSTRTGPTAASDNVSVTRMLPVTVSCHCPCLIGLDQK
jgi:hypothetical protein